jgi:hypothetical protein
MNLYQMRHAILAKHIGQRVTPTQLKVELLAKFPSVKPQSVNASDCHYSDRNEPVPLVRNAGSSAGSQ